MFLMILSSVVSNGYTPKRSGLYWPNTPFLTFLTFGHSECQEN